MKSDVEDLGGSRKKFSFEISPEELQEEVDKYCKKLAREASIRGFRKGKAPTSVIRRFFKQQIHGEVSSQIVSSSLEKALKEGSLTPLGEPDIDVPPLEEGKSFAFKVTVDVKPQIEVKDYQGIPLESDPLEVREEELEGSLKELQKAHAELKGVEEDRGAVPGDTLMVDYECLLDGNPIPGKEKKDTYIELGSGDSKKEVEDALVGARPGQSRDVELTFPPNFIDKEMAGKNIPHRFHIKKIMKKELPNLDDEFAKDVGAFENLGALRERLREQILREKRVRARRRMEEKLLDVILERNPIEAPASMVKARLGRLMVDARAHFLSRGLTMDREHEETKKLETELDAIADKEVRKDLILDAIAMKESLTVSDADVDAEIEKYAERTYQGVEKVRAEIQKQEEGMEQFRQTILRQKTLDFLLPADRMEEGENIKENS